MTIRLAIVEDHPVVVRGLAATITATPDLVLVGRAGTVAEARTLLASVPCDVVLLDLRLPDGSGAEILDHWVAAEGPAFVVLSSFPTPAYLAACLALGALGFLPKTASDEEILDAVRVVASGRMAFTAEQLAAARATTWAPLTARERDLLRGLTAGRSNDELAVDQGLSAKTVEKHLARLFIRFGVASRTELALAMERSAILDLPTRERRTGTR